MVIHDVLLLALRIRLHELLSFENDGKTYHAQPHAIVAAFATLLRNRRRLDAVKPALRSVGQTCRELPVRTIRTTDRERYA